MFGMSRYYIYIYIDIIIHTTNINYPGITSNDQTHIPVAVACQGQSSGVQLEVWPRLLEDSRTCGLRHELDACSSGQRKCE